MKETNLTNTNRFQDCKYPERTIALTGTIDEQVAMLTVAKLLAFEKDSADKEITIFINSHGGSKEAALAIMSAMNHISCPIHTIALIRTESTAVGILATGTERHILPFTTVELHVPDIVFTGISNMENYVDNYVAELSTETGKTTDEIYTAMAVKHDINAWEAVELGIVDSVLLPNPRKNPF